MPNMWTTLLEYICVLLYNYYVSYEKHTTTGAEDGLGVIYPLIHRVIHS